MWFEGRAEAAPDNRIQGRFRTASEAEDRTERDAQPVMGPAVEVDLVADIEAQAQRADVGFSTAELRLEVV